jgi:hypothetical protein
MSEIFLKFIGEKLLDGNVIGEAKAEGRPSDLSAMVFTAMDIDVDIASTISLGFSLFVAHMEDPEAFIHMTIQTIRKIRSEIDIKKR